MRRLLPLALAGLLAITFVPAPAAADPEVQRIFRIPWSASDVALDSSNNVYLASHVWNASEGGLNAQVIKLSASGDLLWGVNLGGSEYDVADAVSVDPSGNIWLGGTTYSNDFPGTAGRWQSAARGVQGDAFVAKLNSNGALQWASYLSGSNHDEVEAIEWAPSGQVVVSGMTWSCDYPTTSGAFDRSGGGCASTSSDSSQGDVFVTKLASDGRSAVFSTYLGGTTQDMPAGIAVSKSSGSVLVGGTTGASDFPTTSGAYDRTINGGSDVFVVKLSSSGALAYGTYLGGSGSEVAHGFTRTSSSQPVIVGETTSANLPVTAGAFQTTFGGGTMCSEIEGGPSPVWVEKVCPDVFVAKLKPDLSGREYVTYLGTERYDVARDVAVDSQGAAYVTGTTNSTAWPKIDSRTTDNGANGVIALALAPNGKEALYSQVMGGARNDRGDEIAATPSGQVWIKAGSPSEDWALSGSGETVIVGLGAPTAGVVLSPRSQSEWWVETYIGGRDADKVVKVEARDEDSAWTTLTKQPWGHYGGSLHVEPGHTVIYRATTSDGRVFTYPDSIQPFHADYSRVSGNAWWIQVHVDANKPLAGVDASINNGAWRPLTLRSWGDWAASYNAPEGSTVQFRARADNGETHESACYRWTSATLVDCGGGSTSDVTFDHKGGNEWWVEVRVDATHEPDYVSACDTGGECKTLTLRSWGNWAGSLHIEPGSRVRFNAVAHGSTADIYNEWSCWYSHPAGDCVAS